jgi:protocatechuate 3,4-dioxygenase beta subunit
VPVFTPSDDGTPYCTIAGIVKDRNKAGLPGASVTLWTCHADGTGRFVNDGVASVENNPQTTSGYESVTPVGSYVFYGASPGWYNVTAEKVDSADVTHVWFAVINATLAGTYMADIAIPDYVTGH